MTPTVCILLCTYNGSKYLKEQLDSLLAQKGVSASILIHDDGSSDGTHDIINEYGIPVTGGSHLGAALGFFYLLEAAPQADYYAFCDQDDIWDDDKLLSAVDMLSSAGDTHALYCCSTRLVNEDGSFITDHIVDSSRTLPARLFYASISGNTICINAKMRDIALMHIPDKMIMHDSWLFKLCIATGGRFLIDEKPHISYRMHGNNEVGMELNLKQKLGKFRRVVSSKGEGQELIDICRLYGSMVIPEYRHLADIAEHSRTDAALRNGFMKKAGIDFKNEGFNTAFAMKVRRGNL